MFDIAGEFAVAQCYAKVVEDEAIEQIRQMCNHKLTEGCHIAIMPDVHAGKGCTIGTTMTIKDKVCPNIVGVDIGCGMLTAEIKEHDIDLSLVDKVWHHIPSGRDVWKSRQEHFDLTQLRCFRELKDSRRLERSLATLGGGNHFAEIDKASNGTLYLIIHSGSRNLGTQVASYYQNLAISLHHGKDKIFKERERIINTCKAEGRASEIAEALKELNRSFQFSKSEVPDDLAWLYDTYLEDYLHDIKICQEFAKRNREGMVRIFFEMTHLTLGQSFHTIHNYIDTDEMILRKGAVAAHEGEKILIPINMRDGSVLALGKGNADWNYSAPHGAGRIMSRSDAKRSIDLEEYKETMQGVYTTSVNSHTLDESPMAYKSLADIIDVINESVDVVDIMKPIYNFKANN